MTTITDNEIDKMVCKLYELSYDEVKITDPDFDTVLSQFNFNHPTDYAKYTLDQLVQLKIQDI